MSYYGVVHKWCHKRFIDSNEIIFASFVWKCHTSSTPISLLNWTSFMNSPFEWMVLDASFRYKISRALFSVFSFFDKRKCFIHTSIKNSLSLSDLKRATVGWKLFLPFWGFFCYFQRGDHKNQKNEVFRRYKIRGECLNKVKIKFS